MLSNLYLAYTSCADALKHIEIDSAEIIGLDHDLLLECSNSFNNVGKSITIAPRRIVSVDKDLAEQCLVATRSTLTGCIPTSMSSARRLAKIAKVFSVVLTNRNHRFVDKSQINFMSQSPTPKYIEVHLHPIVLHIASNNIDIDAEKEFYHIGDVIEHAIRRGVGVIPSAASPRVQEALLVTHIDVILYSMGFSKRERRLMLELYPVDFLQNWLKLRP